MVAEKTLRVGIAGVGPAGTGIMSAFAGHPHLQLTAVADVREDAVNRFRDEHGAEAYLSVAEMCKSPSVDAVWVSTPNHLHAEHAIAAAENGKHVIVSKPLAITMAQAGAMVEAADRNGVKLLCGHTRSMATSIRKMAEVVRKEEFGPLAMIHQWKWADWLYRPRAPYELDVTQGGGVVFRQGPHQIDILRLIAGGMVKSVRASVIQMDPKRPAPGAYIAYLEFEGGIPATMIYSGYAHFDTSELTFGRGGYRFDRVTSDTTPEQEAAMKEGRRYGSERGSAERRGGGGEGDNTLGFYGLTLVSCQRADIRESADGLAVYEEGGQREIPLATKESRGDNELEELYEAVVNGGPVVHDGPWGLATLEVVLGILESAKTGREIKMTHQVPSRYP
jgi:phthalate 4,5-cis-dihydrodiol dehydrogenase